MSIYFSPSTCSFFNSAIHGPRQISQVDADAQQRALSKLTQREDNAEADEQTAIDAERSRLLREPIMMMVDNPLCVIPRDAIEVARDEHDKLLKGQANGMEIYAGRGGRPQLRQRALAHDEVLAAARRMRDKELSASDWTQLADATLSAAKKKAWKEHRQRLRDLPSEVEKALAGGVDVDLDTLMPVKP